MGLWPPVCVSFKSRKMGGIFEGRGQERRHSRQLSSRYPVPVGRGRVVFALPNPVPVTSDYLLPRRNSARPPAPPTRPARPRPAPPGGGPALTRVVAGLDTAVHWGHGHSQALVQPPSAGAARPRPRAQQAPGSGTAPSPSVPKQPGTPSPQLLGRRPHAGVRPRLCGCVIPG